MNLIKRLLERLLLGLVAFVVVVLFHYFGRFTIPASILLGVSFTIVGLWLYFLWRLAVFQPYCIEIFVDFDTLCQDLGLPRAPVNGERVVYEIYKFTALNPTVFAHYAALATKTSEQVGAVPVRSETDYRTSIIFGNRVPCVLASESFNNPENRDLLPRFFFRPERNGYTFGIGIVESWWFEHRQKLGAPMQNATVHSNGEIDLCVLPYGYIPNHVRHWNWNDEYSFLYSLFGFRQRRWATKLKKLGWEVNEIDPAHIEHRYLSIRYDMLFG